MQKIELEIVALSHSVAQSQSYAVVLGEVDGMRRLPIVIGGFEAQAIAVAIEKITPHRPLTHDLIKNIFNVLDVVLKEIIVDKLEGGIFFSKLICINSLGQEIEVDSRTSDALALAVRFNCPIFTYEGILEEAGIVLEEGSESPAREKKETAKSEPVVKEDELSTYSTEQLKDMLKQLLESEDYEKAINIRDELDRRKQGS